MMIYTILTCGAAAHDKQTTKKRRTFFSLSLSLSLSIHEMESIII